MTNGRSTIMGLLRVSRRTETKENKSLRVMQSLQVQHTTDSCVTIQTCPLHQRLIHGDEHLKKGCRFWKKDVRIFAPEAA